MAITLLLSQVPKGGAAPPTTEVTKPPAVLQAQDRKPPVAYKTEIIGGVVVHTPISISQVSCGHCCTAGVSRGGVPKDGVVLLCSSWCPAGEVWEEEKEARSAQCVPAQRGPGTAQGSGGGCSWPCCLRLLCTLGSEKQCCACNAFPLRVYK